MSKNSTLGFKYKIYLNGDIYTLENTYVGKIYNQAIMDFIENNIWRSKDDKKLLDELIEGRPESFNEYL